MKITQWPAAERPREKLLQKGALTLSDAELLAIFIRTGIPGLNAVDLARQLLTQFGSLDKLFDASLEVFCQAKGLGEAKYVQLHAALELSRRYLQANLQQTPQFTSSSQTRDYIASQLAHHKQEVFAVMLLDTQHRLLHFQPVFFGTIDSAPVYPRELVKLAIEHNAAALVLAHNHPSGVAEPSLADETITRQIIEAMALLDIRVLDHIIVGKGQQTSMAERGLL